MKKPLGAGRILANISALKGFTTKRELADLFGVGPSAVTDWTNRKGDRIPERRLADIARAQGFSWDWLIYGEGSPFAVTARVAATQIELDPSEIELLAKIKGSPAFKKAVQKLVGLPEEEMSLIGSLADSLRTREGRRTPPATFSPHAGGEARGGVAESKKTSESPYLKWNSRYPLTTNK